MAAAKLKPSISEEFDKLRVVFGSEISFEDFVVLYDEFCSDNELEFIENVYEALEASRFTTVNELVWHIRQDPSYSSRRSSSSHRSGSRKDSWSLARSKSNNIVNKNVGNPQPSSSCGAERLAMPFSGTRNPIQILRSSKLFDSSDIRSYLTKYMQDTETRTLLYDVYENRYPKLMILMRGASGSGKSTLASVIWAITEKGEICSADHYFMNRNGYYKFNRASLNDAHESCRNHCRVALGRGDSPIVIDNTNTTEDEMLPYVQMAVDYNYEVKIIEPNTEWKRKAGILAQKNIHGVPKRTIEFQLGRFEVTTAKNMIDRILKKQGASKNNYRSAQNLEWGSTPTMSTETWMANGRTSQTGEISSMMSSMCFSSPTKTKASTSSPSPTQCAQFSWSEPPASAPPSPLLLSDLVPDLKRGNINSGAKPKRPAKRAGNANISTTATGSATPPIVFEDPAHLEFKKLQKLFPSVPRDELEQIFNVYEGDVDLCASALMDQGVEMTGNLDHFSQTQTEEAPQAAGYGDRLCNTNGEFTETYGNNIDQNEKISRIAGTNNYEKADNFSDTGIADEADSFEMVLPVEFARLLLCVYGNPSDEKRQLSIDELTVKVPPDAAFEIYKSLYSNIHKVEDETAKSSTSEDSTRSNSPTDDKINDDEFNAIAISLSQMELETSSGDPQLSAIIDLEAKINQQTQEFLQDYTPPNRTMAQNINFSLLKQEYPYLDASVIDEVYTQCFLNIEKTRAWLTEMYPHSTAQAQTNQAASVTGTWHLKYNPKDVQLYSPEDIKTVERTYDELEREWLDHLEKMKECYNKCKTLTNAQIRGHYIAEAKSISDKMKTLADEMQYYKAISINAKHKNDQILDLHGLKIGGAMRVLKEFLQFKEEEYINAGIPKMILLIITGQGRHSKNGCPILQPAVRNYLTQRKYRFHSGKPGTYTVILSRSGTGRKK